MTVAYTHTPLGKVTLDLKTLFFLALFGLLLASLFFPEYGLAWPWSSDSDSGGAGSAVSPGFVSEILQLFKTRTDQWMGQLKPMAERLLYWFAVFEMVYIGIHIALGQINIGDAIKQLVTFILMVGFFLAVIHNYDTWIGNLINGLSSGQNSVASSLGVPVTASEAPFKAGLKLAQDIWGQTSFFRPGDSVGLLLVGLIVLISFVIITARMVLIKCEAMVALTAALLLVGFGGSSFTKDYAVSVIRYVFSVAMKLFVMQLVIAVGLGIIDGVQIDSADLGDLAVIIGASIVLLAMVGTLPGIVSGIMNGAHIGSGAGLGAAARGVGAGAAALGGAVIGAGVGLAGAALGPAGMAAGAAKVAGSAGKLLSGSSRAVGHIARGADGKEGGGQSKPQRSQIMKERYEAAQKERPRPKK